MLTAMTTQEGGTTGGAMAPTNFHPKREDVSETQSETAEGTGMSQQSTQNQSAQN